MALEEELDIPQELLDMGAPHSEEFQKLVYGFAYRFYENGKCEEAIRFFRFLTMLNPFHFDYWKGLGAARQQNKEYEKAIEAYSVAATITQSEEDPYLYLHSADCFLALDNVDRALEALDAAKALSFNHADSEQLLAHIKLIRKAWKNKSPTHLSKEV